MPVALLLIGAGVFVTGISALAMHNSVSKSNSKATSSSNILSEIEETKKSFDEEIKKKLLQGTVTIVVYIQYRQQIKKQQHEEMIRSIGGGVTAAASALATAVVINNVQDAIADSQKEQGQQIGSTTSETTAVDTKQGDYVEKFPAITQEGPQIYDTPADQIEVPLTTTFPWIQSEPQVYDTPGDTAIEIPAINIFPEIKAKELEDSILCIDRYNDLPNKGVWPKGDPDLVKGELTNFKNKLDELFGSEGEWVSDGPTTKGRKQVKWKFQDGTEIIWERHPYDRSKGWSSTHTERHYHIELPDGTHGPGFKGTN